MKRTPLSLLGLYQPSWKTKNTERITHEKPKYYRFLQKRLQKNISF